MKTLLKKLYNTNSLDRDEMLYLLDHMDEDTQELLYFYADAAKVENYGKAVYLRGLIEFSNYCKNTCMYCGIRGENAAIRRYRLTNAQIMECCAVGDRLGLKTFVLQSGEDDFYTDDILVDIIRQIKECFPYCAVTLSIGERSYMSYKRFFEAGADRFLLRHETASGELYKKLHPGMSFENRQRCLSDLKEIGYQVGAGFIVGLPGQDNKTLVEDLLYLKGLQPHMVGIGPLVIHPQTPLRKYKGGGLEKTLICLALTRLLLPEVLLPSTTALSVTDEEGMQKALKAGANVIMPNITHDFAREMYELYKGKSGMTVDIEKIAEEVEKAGCHIDMSRGDHRSWKRKACVI